MNATPEATLHIITKPDTEQGRGRKLSPSAVKKWALENTPTCAIHTPTTKNEITSLVNKINPDLIIIIAYGMIVPKDVTDHYLCINAHASILPKYRGPSLSIPHC